MDNIEVRVEELISKHARDLDKEETERIKWMKSEAEYFNKTNPSSGSGGGFFDQIIKAITGGGKGGGMMGAGVAGGMAAGGIMALVDIIGDAVSNSKILTTVLGTIGQALGLLIDVILLPFLPILITGIIWLYQGIMQFYKLWNSVKTLGDALDKLTAALGTSSWEGWGHCRRTCIGWRINNNCAVRHPRVQERLLRLPNSPALVVMGGYSAIIGDFTPLAYISRELSERWFYLTGFTMLLRGKPQ